MQFTILGFSQQRLLDLGLRAELTILLDWFVHFRTSGNQQSIIQDDREWFWISYRKLKSDLPSFKISEWAVRKGLNKLCGEGPLPDGRTPEDYPLAKKVVATQKGHRTYFSTRVAYQLLKGDELMVESLVTGEEVRPGVLAKNKQKRVLIPEVTELIHALRGILVNGDGSVQLFTTKPPEDEYHYSKTIKGFVDKVSAVYLGRFARDFQSDPEWLKQNVTTGVASKLRQAKGEWGKVHDLVDEAVENYRMMFLPEYEPASKEHLVHCLSRWMYDEYHRKSLFLESLSGKPAYLEERITDGIYGSLPAEITEMAETIRRETFDERKFWYRISRVVEWYDEFHQGMVDADPNAGYWFDGSVEAWFAKYIEYLSGYGAPRITQIGPKNKTWADWLSRARETHEMVVDPADYV